jgi:hypothetical protein
VLVIPTSIILLLSCMQADQSPSAVAQHLWTDPAMLARGSQPPATCSALLLAYS